MICTLYRIQLILLNELWKKWHLNTINNEPSDHRVIEKGFPLTRTQDHFLYQISFVSNILFLIKHLLGYKHFKSTPSCLFSNNNFSLISTIWE